MKIDLLVSPGCLSRNETEQLIRNLIAELAPGATLQMTVVDSVDMAANLKFAGSPTVKIDGRDLEPEVDKWLHFGLG